MNIESLLGREPIQVDMEAIKQGLQNKTIMITGAAGSIGSELLRQVTAMKPKHIIAVDMAESPLHDTVLHLRRAYLQQSIHAVVGNITDRRRMHSVMSQEMPDIILHCAAYKHVALMEECPATCISNNVGGTKVIADLAVELGVKKFVMVSTDKAVAPTSVMGCSKRICELYIQSLDKHIKEERTEQTTQLMTVRFGNVLGSNGSVIPIFRKQISEGGPVTVTHPDVKRFFMTISEACRLVLETAVKGHSGEAYVFDMGEPVKIIDLARKMIEQSGQDIDIEIIGLKDGEKLDETLYDIGSEVRHTTNPKILAARIYPEKLSDLSPKIEELLLISQTSTDEKVISEMQKIVPTYWPSRHGQIK